MDNSYHSPFFPNQGGAMSNVFSLRVSRIQNSVAFSLQPRLYAEASPFFFPFIVLTIQFNCWTMVFYLLVSFCIKRKTATVMTSTSICFSSSEKFTFPIIQSRKSMMSFSPIVNQSLLRPRGILFSYIKNQHSKNEYHIMKVSQFLYFFINSPVSFPFKGIILNYLGKSSSNVSSLVT